MEVRKGDMEDKKGRKEGRREVRNEGRERSEEGRDRGKHRIRLRQGSTCKERGRKDGLEGEGNNFRTPQFQHNYWTFHYKTTVLNPPLHTEISNVF